MSVIQKFTDWTPERRGYWLSRLLTPLFGKSIRCRRCEKHLGKALFYVRDGKLICLGLHQHRIRLVFTGTYGAAFECVSDCNSIPDHSVSQEVSLPPPSVVHHLVLGHQGPEYLEPYLNYHQHLAGSESTLVLVHGGSLEDFEKIQWPHKIHSKDPALRGEGFYQSYSRIIQAGYKYLQSHATAASHVMFSESDAWALQSNYLKATAGDMISREADFAAAGFVRVDQSNDGHLARALREGSLEERLSVHKTHNLPPVYYHSLGACFIFSHAALEDFCSLRHDDSKCFLEIYIPSIFVNRGWRGADLRSHGSVFSAVRYRPTFCAQELRDAKKSGLHWIHPFKELPLDGE